MCIEYVADRSVIRIQIFIQAQGYDSPSGSMYAPSLNISAMWNVMSVSFLFLAQISVP